MLKFSQSQFEQLATAAHAQFVIRLDAFMAAQVGTRWTDRPAGLRRAQIEAAVEHGVALGIAEEVYVAQFTLVSLIRGERFLREPASMQILNSARMTWRQKLFQLTALAGIDLSDGAGLGRGTT